MIIGKSLERMNVGITIFKYSERKFAGDNCRQINTQISFIKLWKFLIECRSSNILQCSNFLIFRNEMHKN